jgi:tetratricopeptide (TPR) repeat protein
MPSHAFRVKVSDVLTGIVILGLVALAYRQVGSAGFIWDDKIDFKDAAWLRHGDDWWKFMAQGIAGWVNYFRPLVVALMTLELRLFDVNATPMHLVSLGIHLANTALVGLLALRLTGSDSGSMRARIAAGATMLLFGLHPALIEPVVWISCQGDLVVTFLVLLALHCNAMFERTPLRAFAVGLCFFLAACAKESAAALPLLLVIFDAYAIAPNTATTSWPETIKAIWKRQKFVYLAVLLAGLTYLVLRHIALGFLVSQIGNESFLSIPRLQKICFTYLTYWRILLWPMVGLGPLHVVDEQRFAIVDMASIATDVATLLIAIAGVFCFIKRKAGGSLILAFSVALIPALNIVPVAFVESVYHERYAMTALAMACVWLPLMMLALHTQPAIRRVIDAAAFGAILVWLGFAVLNIQVTVPLWSDDLNLWQWALRQDPHSIIAEDHLLTEYMAHDDYAHARALADRLVAEKAQCPNCMLNAAYLALADRDVERASVALNGLQQGAALAYDSRLLHGFILASAELRELQGDFKGAEEAYHDAVTADPYDPSPHMQLAMMLIRQGRIEEAHTAADTALSLYSSDIREQHRRELEQAFKAADSRTPAAGK